MDKRIRTLVVVVLLAIVGGGHAIAQEKGVSRATDKKSVVTEATFQDGPTIEPTAALLEWLNFVPKRHTIGKRLLRLPVVFFFEKDALLRSPSAVIGSPGISSPEGLIPLRILDGRLGISLMERLRADCPEKASSCALWLEGYWGGELPLPEAENDRKKQSSWPFTVVRVGAFFHQIETGTKTLRVGYVEPAH